MRIGIIVTALVLLMIKLNALEIISPQNNKISISYQELANQEQQSFNTTRNKNGKLISETWQGIALLPWLAKLGLSDWHSLQSLSADGYEVRMHRMDLDQMPAFLALKQDQQALAESDLRLIYPEAKENLWLRGVTSIRLESFTSIPNPRQLFLWDTESPAFHWDETSLKLSELMNYGFHQNKGTIVLADANLNCLTLEYPAQLNKASLDYDGLGSLQLSGVKLEGKLKLDNIIYLQCGPYAYLRNEHLPKLIAIGQALNWDWERIQAYQVSGQKSILQGDQSQRENPALDWIELH